MTTPVRLTFALGMAALILLAGGRLEAQERAGTPRPVRIGCKHFTEQWILGEIAAQLLERHGVAVERKFHLQGTMVCFEALRHGDIDLYPEYTGTGLVAILHEEVPEQRRRVAGRVQEVFLERWDLVWHTYLGFNNTYALAVRRDTASSLKVQTISDLRAHAPTLTLGCGTEFLSRPDGYPGLARAYGLKFGATRSLDPNLTYGAIAQKTVDVIDVYSTDGRLKTNDLAVLEDDRGFFPPYSAAFLTRREVLTSRPAVAAILGRLEYQLDDETMRRLNQRVDSGEATAPAVAASFLKTLKTSESPVASPGSNAAPQPAGAPASPVPSALWAWWSTLCGLTLVHLRITAMAVALAVVVGVPLGILLTRMPRLARPGLGLVSVLQTLPSMALLGFLIPFTGIGAVPAVVALFIYALLPIVRNTYVGLTGLDPVLAEVAVGLGLTDRQRLLQIELPLAVPVLMGGVRTSAVIAVGTATLAALIGGGGLGEPIFRGIALMDQRMILSGAVPAALLALGLDLILGNVEARLKSPASSPASKPLAGGH